MSEVPGWLDQLSFSTGPPWHSMGTRGLDPREWLVIDDHRDEELVRKRELLEQARETVSVALPGSEDAQHEVAGLISEAAATTVPRAAGWSPLEAAAVVVQEDLCLLIERDCRWRLDAAVVCFPSMWDVRAKLGLPVAEVHAPVPAYADELGARVDRFLERLRPDRPVWRRNWLIHDTPELHLPSPPPPRTGDVAVPGDLWLRSERQTLRRLSRTGAILFTIRTQQVALRAVAARPDVARQMAAAIRSWSPELLAYRSATVWRDRLLAWLESTAELRSR